MALEVHYATALTVWHEPLDGVLATTATAVLRKPGGTTLETLTVTAPTAGSRTIAAGSTADALIVSSATGVTVGHRWRVTSDGVRHVLTVARVDGTTVYPMEPLAVVPDTGSAFEPIRMTATIAAPGESLIGANYRLEWLYDDGTTEGFGSDTVNVVYWKWDDPVTGARIRQYVSHQFPSVLQRREPAYWDQVAADACAQIRAAVESAGRRPYLYGDTDVFARAGYECARWMLAKEGLVPRGSNPGIFEAQIRAEYDREMMQALSSLAQYDRNNDGAISSDEARGMWWSIGTSR